ncbi:hypothetical protein MC885_016980 [Smutsia gigantea]|nr:hypothetical protein MC885_016980 [Smutsia gigantea]
MPDHTGCPHAQPRPSVLVTPSPPSGPAGPPEPVAAAATSVQPLPAGSPWRPLAAAPGQPRRRQRSAQPAPACVLCPPPPRLTSKEEPVLVTSKESRLHQSPRRQRAPSTTGCLSLSYVPGQTLPVPGQAHTWCCFCRCHTALRLWP